MRDHEDARFREVYTDHVDRVLGFALRRVLTREDAADVVAETFLVAWRRRRHLPAGDEALPWLYGVARKVLANQRRGLIRRERLAARLRNELGGQLRGALAAGRAVDPTESVVEVHAVREAMERLGDLDREVLRLTAWEQLEPREIAVVLGIAPAAVRTRLTRARSRLRRELGDDAGHAGHEPVVRPVLTSREK